MKKWKMMFQSGSYKLTLKKSIVEELEWDNKTELKQKRVGKRLIIEEVK